MKNYMKKINLVLCMSLLLITASSGQGDYYLMKLDSSIELHTLVDSGIKKVKLNLSSVPGTQLKKYYAFTNPYTPIEIRAYDSVVLKNYGVWLSDWNFKESLVVANPSTLKLQKEESPPISRISWGILTGYIFMTIWAFLLGISIGRVSYETDRRPILGIWSISFAFLLGIGMGTLIPHGVNTQGGLMVIIIICILYLLFLLTHGLWPFGLSKDEKNEMTVGSSALGALIGGAMGTCLKYNLFTLILPISGIFIFFLLIGLRLSYIQYKKYYSVKYA